MRPSPWRATRTVSRCLGDLVVEFPYLIFEQEPRAGEHIRIWREQEDRFSFEHLMPTGKGITIPCASLSEALSLWEGFKAKMLIQERTAKA